MALKRDFRQCAGRETYQLHSMNAPLNGARHAFGSYGPCRNCKEIVVYVHYTDNGGSWGIWVTRTRIAEWP